MSLFGPRSVRLRVHLNPYPFLIGIRTVSENIKDSSLQVGELRDVTRHTYISKQTASSLKILAIARDAAEAFVSTVVALNISVAKVFHRNAL